MTSIQFTAIKKMPPLHTIDTVVVGNLVPQPIKGLTVTRDEFRAAAEKALGRVPLEQRDFVRETVWEAVDTVDRFPLGAWMEKRGCGCLVGETVAAQAVLSRREFAERPERVINQLHAVYPFEQARALETYGYKVDTAMRDLAHSLQGRDATHLDALFIQD